MRLAREIVATEPLRSVRRARALPRRRPARTTSRPTCAAASSCSTTRSGTCRMGTDDDVGGRRRAARARRRGPARGRRLDHAADPGRQHERADDHGRRARGRPRQGPRGRREPASLAPIRPTTGCGPRWRRVWAVYDGAYDEIQVEIRERLADHPQFGPLIRDTPEDPEEEAASRARLRAAMVDWDWDGYWENTRMQAAGYATAEIPLASWVELVNLFRHDMLERRVRARRAPSTGSRTCRRCDRWLDDAIGAFAQAFVDANERVIARASSRRSASSRRRCCSCARAC